MSDFLGISASLSGRRWVGPTIEQDRQAQALSQDTTLPLPLCRRSLHPQRPPYRKIEIFKAGGPFIAVHLRRIQSAAGYCALHEISVYIHKNTDSPGGTVKPRHNLL